MEVKRSCQVQKSLWRHHLQPEASPWGADLYLKRGAFESTSKPGPVWPVPRARWPLSLCRFGTGSVAATGALNSSAFPPAFPLGAGSSMGSSLGLFWMPLERVGGAGAAWRCSEGGTEGRKDSIYRAAASLGLSTGCCQIQALLC